MVSMRADHIDAHRISISRKTIDMPIVIEDGEGLKVWSLLTRGLIKSYR